MCEIYISSRDVQLDFQLDFNYIFNYYSTIIRLTRRITLTTRAGTSRFAHWAPIS